MKQILTGLLLFVVCVIAHGQKKLSYYEDYIEKHKELAVEQMLRFRIPASVTLAQALLETGGGRSRLAREANNHFGIKCHNSWNGPYIRVDDDAPHEKFRAYRNVAESYEDHSIFLQQPRYASLFRLSPSDYKGWAHGLKKCGYATNPRYGHILIDLIQRYDLNKYDKYASLRDLKKGRKTSSLSDSDNTPTGIHPVMRNNDNYYIRAKTGDNLLSIAKETGVSPRRLRSYNEVPDDYIPASGDIIYLKKKQRKAHRCLKGHSHVVEPGESMHSISQRYGMRLKYLYKLNHLPNDYIPQPGHKLRVR